MNTKLENQIRLFNRLQELGFTFEEAQTLRRIEMTLHRWAELECGDGNDHASWSIERDETTGKPYRCVYPHTGKMYRTAVADREKGALKRLQAILAAVNKRREEIARASGERVSIYQPVFAYHQTDPRGCALYIVPGSAIPQGVKLNSCYTNGVAVAA